jgi:serine/threonine protein kinase/formylglycine-generating enzyme required for sulfatase activity
MADLLLEHSRGIQGSSHYYHSHWIYGSMNNKFNNRKDSDSEMNQLEDLYARWRILWEQGGSPQLEEFMSQIPQSQHTEAFQELIRVEYEWSVKQGIHPNLESYHKRFPLYEKELLDIFQELKQQDHNPFEADTVISNDTSNSPLTNPQILTQKTELAPSLSTNEFLERVVNAGLLSQLTLQNSETINSPDGSGMVTDVVDGLINKGLLTRFQVEEIFADRGEQITLGNYTLLEPLGQGGMGSVYKAKHRTMNRVVALKLITQTHDPKMRQRFQKEIDAVSKLNHPNIVTAYDASIEKDVCFLAMELIEGVDLSRLIRQAGPLDFRKAVSYVRQVALGLQHAHDAGISHRDIKPANLICSDDDQIKILDLGLAHIRQPDKTQDDQRLTNSGAILGTVDFMAPEQAFQVKETDASADIYSLGCTLYYLLSGDPPFPKETPLATLYSHQHDPPPKLTEINDQIPLWLEEIYLKMMSKNKTDRQSHMAELIAELDQQINTSLPSPEEITINNATAKNSNTRKRVISILVLGILIALSLTIFPWSPQTNQNLSPVQDTTKSLPLETDPHSMLQITINDPNISVSIKGTDHLFKKSEKPKELRLSSGEKTLVIQGTNYTFEADPLLLKPNETATIHVERIANKVRVLQDNLLQSLKVLDNKQISMPPLAKGQFDSQAAKLHQKAWSDYLNLPIEKEIDLGNDQKLILVLIPPGEFMMGTSQEDRERLSKQAKLESENGWGVESIRKVEGPQHLVRITQPFYLGKYEVTKAQWEAVMGKEVVKPSKKKKPPKKVTELTPSHPKGGATWEQTQDFLNQINVMPRSDKFKFVLPTEAQWEYACRAGTISSWHFGEDDSELAEWGWYDSNSEQTTHPVGQLGPNPFGLHDMYGNLWEWCADYFLRDYYIDSPVEDPRGPESLPESNKNLERVLRGGSYFYQTGFSWSCRSAYRHSHSEFSGHPTVGFRIATVLKELREETGNTKGVLNSQLKQEN